MARRLHLTLRMDQRTRVTATFRRLWGEYDGPHPVIRLQLDPPPGVDWHWIMSCIAVHAHEVPVPDDFEDLTSQDRYELLRGEVMRLYEARRDQPDTGRDRAKVDALLRARREG